MFALIENADRELYVDMFDTYQEAEDEMHRRYNEAGSADSEGWGKDYAYKNDANGHMDFDWQIQELADICRVK